VAQGDKSPLGGLGVPDEFGCGRKATDNGEREHCIAPTRMCLCFQKLIDWLKSLDLGQIEAHL
jgi:hypothetical protein